MKSEVGSVYLLQSQFLWMFNSPVVLELGQQQLHPSQSSINILWNLHNSQYQSNCLGTCFLVKNLADPLARFLLPDQVSALQHLQLFVHHVLRRVQHAADKNSSLRHFMFPRTKMGTEQTCSWQEQICERLCVGQPLFKLLGVNLPRHFEKAETHKGTGKVLTRTFSQREGRAQVTGGASSGCSSHRHTSGEVA